MVEGVRLHLELPLAPRRNDLQPVRLENVLRQLAPPDTEPARQALYLCLVFSFALTTLFQGPVMCVDQVPGETDLGVVQVSPQGPGGPPLVLQSRHVGVSAGDRFFLLILPVVYVHTRVVYRLFQQIPQALGNRALAGQLQKIRVP